MENSVGGTKLTRISPGLLRHEDVPAFRRCLAAKGVESGPAALSRRSGPIPIVWWISIWDLINNVTGTPGVVVKIEISEDDININIGKKRLNGKKQGRGRAG